MLPNLELLSSVALLTVHPIRPAMKVVWQTTRLLVAYLSLHLGLECTLESISAEL